MINPVLESYSFNLFRGFTSDARRPRGGAVSIRRVFRLVRRGDSPRGEEYGMRNRVFFGAAFAAILLAALLVCSTASATANLNLIVAGPDPAEPVTVEIEAPDGTTQTATLDKGRAVVQPEGPPGTYRSPSTSAGSPRPPRCRFPTTGRWWSPIGPTPKARRSSIDEPGPIENIMVTARRVEEPLQKVPVAITAFTTKDIENKHITNIQQLALATPNLWMEKNTSSSSGSRASIRGIGEDESMFTSDTPVGIYIDDVYIPRQTGAQFDLYEVERLEVLRGPQGNPLWPQHQRRRHQTRFQTAEPGVRAESVCGGRELRPDSTPEAWSASPWSTGSVSRSPP